MSDLKDKYANRANKKVEGKHTGKVVKDWNNNSDWNDKRERGRAFAPQAPAHTSQKPYNVNAAQKSLENKRSTASKKADSFKQREKERSKETGKDQKGPDRDR